MISGRGQTGAPERCDKRDYPHVDKALIPRIGAAPAPSCPPAPISSSSSPLSLSPPWAEPLLLLLPLLPGPPLALADNPSLTEALIHHVLSRHPGLSAPTWADISLIHWGPLPPPPPLLLLQLPPLHMRMDTPSRALALAMFALRI